MAGGLDEVHKETDEARGGSTPRVVRWILAISLVGAIVLLSAVWIIGAAMQGDSESRATAQRATDRAAVEASEGNDTDGILIDEVDDIEGPTTGSDPALVPNRTEEEPVLDEQ